LEAVATNHGHGSVRIGVVNTSNQCKEKERLTDPWQRQPGAGKCLP
jgi:hypothetical protein